MKKKQVLTSEEAEKISRENRLRDITDLFNRRLIPENPTRIFKIGDEVKVGALKNCKVTEVFFDGLAYSVHYDYMGQAYGSPVRMMRDNIWTWTSVYPMTSYCVGEPMADINDVRIDFSNCDIDSLLHKVYHAGVDFNPDYQRDLVWTEEQKLSLIDSIFNNIEVGKFTFIRLGFDSVKPYYYEILDGKQRLRTLMEFYEDRFAYKGKKFSELCGRDANHFTSFPVVQGEVSKLTQQQIYKLFVKMNTSGTPVSEEHLNKIKSLIK